MEKSTRSKQEAAALRNKYLIYGLGAGAVLGGGYLLYSYLQDRKVLERGQALTVNNILPGLPSLPRQTPAHSNTGGFPLKAGSKGTLVRQLQQALLNKGGTAGQYIRTTSIRPDGTPDGVFGQGTSRALKAAGYPVTVSASLFQQITGQRAGVADHKALADELIKAANSRNLFAVLAVLKQMKDTHDYLAVRSHFGNARVGGVRVTTPVNALLSVAFKTNEPAKVKVRAEFQRMGLKQTASGTWALSGLSGSADLQRYLLADQVLDVAITRKPTVLKDGRGNDLFPALPPETVVGYLTNRRRGVAQVLTENGVTVYAPGQNLKLI